MPSQKIPKICLFFEAHQPNRLKPYSFFHIGNDPFYEDDQLNQDILNQVSENCYLPANQLFTKLIEESEGDFCFSMSLSGVLIEQLEHHRPDVLQSFQKLHATGGVELLGETYHHSMDFQLSPVEFARQVKLHEAKIQEHFGVTPTSYRHSEMVYYNELAKFVGQMGYKIMLAEGVPHILGGRSPNHLYRSPTVKSMKVLPRHSSLSDDLSHRFPHKSWEGYPLTPDKYASWCADSGGQILNLFMDYESIGERIPAASGIFEFWEQFPTAWKKRKGQFSQVNELTRHHSKGIYDCHTPTSWAGEEKDLSPWRGNEMQREARQKILLMEDAIKERNDPELLHQWAKMHTSDHFHFMSTKEETAGKTPHDLRPYDTPYDAYIFFMNALSDLQLRLESRGPVNAGKS